MSLDRSGARAFFAAIIAMCLAGCDCGDCSDAPDELRSSHYTWRYVDGDTEIQPPGFGISDRVLNVNKSAGTVQIVYEESGHQVIETWRITSDQMRDTN